MTRLEIVPDIVRSWCCSGEAHLGRAFAETGNPIAIRRRPCWV